MENERFSGHLTNVTIDKDLVTMKIDDFDGLINLFRKGKIDFDIIPHSKDLISGIQRRKAYAMIRDICEYQGYVQVFEREKQKKKLKEEFCENSGYQMFSLSDCKKDVATQFISFLVEYCFEYDVPFQFKDLVNTFDTERRVYLCLLHRRCTACGATKDIQINHEDTVGSGNNRNHLDHRQHRLEALCANCHARFHHIGAESFYEEQHFHGIKLSDEMLISMKLMSRKQMQEFDEQYKREEMEQRLISGAERRETR
ncbi:putative HNHc nuclease [Liquorilactobacillus uvarum]|uniref:putative HNHc nuclease n=1 Tax=Liquorilactobacillus uvarum TaxID=303240 RepID=UPI0028891897|nr:putative HNHc nuclease [Liquorilactobacillus uvarum]